MDTFTLVSEESIKTGSTKCEYRKNKWLELGMRISRFCIIRILTPHDLFKAKAAAALQKKDWLA